MSVDSCVAFLERVRDSSALNQELKAMSDPMELVALGLRHGYSFGPAEIATASASVRFESAGRTDSSGPTPQPERSVFYHYEFDLDRFPVFDEVREALGRLRTMPSTVDLHAFRQTFRADDFAWADMSPDAPEFSAVYEDVMSHHWQESPGAGEFRRDFHLVNLDKHTDHAAYQEYFATKVQMVSTLERIFGGTVQVSGSLWYPPSAYRLWHTNETQPGWRMYLVDLDGEDSPSSGTAFFRYMNPHTKEIVTLEDRPRMMRLFKIEQEPDKLFWHCIVNASNRNRWSFGYAVPDDWQARLADVGVIPAQSSVAAS